MKEDSILCCTKGYSSSSGGIGHTVFASYMRFIFYASILLFSMENEMNIISYGQDYLFIRELYQLRSIKTVVSQKTIRMIYFAYAHSVTNYGIIFWGNS
jgi:glutathionyl-hydroquinone reductase